MISTLALLCCLFKKHFYSNFLCRSYFGFCCCYSVIIDEINARVVIIALLLRTIPFFGHACRLLLSTDLR